MQSPLYAACPWLPLSCPHPLFHPHKNSRTWTTDWVSELSQAKNRIIPAARLLHTMCRSFLQILGIIYLAGIFGISGIFVICCILCFFFAFAFIFITFLFLLALPSIWWPHVAARCKWRHFMCGCSNCVAPLPRGNPVIASAGVSLCLGYAFIVD